MAVKFAATFVVILTFCLGGAALAQKTASPEPASPASIDSIVKAQLDAFQRNDGAAAFSWASEFIQKQFGTAEIFMQMVKSSYPIVYKHRRALFLDVVDIGGITVQRVVFEDEQGRTLMAHYPMIRNKNGEWRINGCYLLPAGEAT